MKGALAARQLCLAVGYGQLVGSGQLIGGPVSCLVHADSLIPECFQATVDTQHGLSQHSLG